MDQSVQVKLGTKVGDIPREKKIYSGAALRVMKLLGNGVLQVEAARACGVGEAFVSQLMAESDFISQVNEIVSRNFALQSEIDNNYVEVEKKLSERLLKNSELIYGTDQMLRVLKFANEAKRKTAPVHQNNGSGSPDGTGNLKPVVLILPTVVVREFVLNPMNEIVGINGSELATLPSAQLPNLVTKHREELAKELLEKKQGYKIIPNGSRPTDPYSDL